jgi:ParB/RepB/Spo0J family partition protein
LSTVDRESDTHDPSGGSILTAATPPVGELVYLSADQLRRSPNNPRKLFDPGPMAELKDNIRENGVLVPITVYRLKGSDRFAIIDGERRFR